MEPLFLAVICGCNAGLLREALHEVYIPRIQRGDAHFAANVLGATGPLLSALGHFFEQGAARFEHGYCSAGLHRLRGVCLATLGADEAQIEASFCEAIRIAKEQKSVSVGKRAEGTYAEYHRQKANASGGPGFRLPLY